jgi:hypothetical protein
MRPLVVGITLAVLGVNTMSAVPQRDYSKLIVGSWYHTCRMRPMRILVFHADGRWGVRKYDDPRPEDIRGRRWRVEGDKLILRYPHDQSFETHAYRILSFTPREFITDGEYPCTYTRVAQSQ